MAGLRTQAASSTTSPSTFHVFLSFRGKDTRKTFTDHLNTALLHAGFDVFRDNDEIQRGENIKSEVEQAIRNSRSSIIVISKGYPFSTWCLDELVMILEQKRTSQHLVLPLFYDVEPFQVRKQTGVFAEAFARHEERFKDERDQRKIGLEKVKCWRAALTEVSYLAGMELQHQSDGYESKFIQKVVEEIDAKLKHVVLSITPNLVGIHSRAKSINAWLQDGSTDVSIILICGGGGMGKSTIAKFVYNQNFQKFQGSSFLSNVRETSHQSNGLTNLQRQLLLDILKRKQKKIWNVDEGIVKIKDTMSYRRVLVVLDDVDRPDQLNAILGMRDWFHQGSKIIITTRHERLLEAHETYKVHKVEYLDDDESLELFSWHAFGLNHPIDDYMELSKKVAKRCGGLPLALQVLGSSLSGKSIDIWENSLEKLKAVPDREIFEKLKLSYDSLQDDYDRELFLEIACFFVGKHKDFMVTVLDKCNFYTAVGIQNLMERFLLTIDEDNKLRMHQLLQDMGREIVRQESPKEPGIRSRLWHHYDSINVLREKTGTGALEGLMLDMHSLNDVKSDERIYGINSSRNHNLKEFFDESRMSSHNHSVKRSCLSHFSWNSINIPSANSVDQLELMTDAFARMHALRILQMNYVQLSGPNGNLPKRLRWLCWHGCPLKLIPYDFPLESLIAIDLRYSNLTQVWKETRFLGLLKILNLGHSHKLVKTPDFSLLPNLERLILKGCTSLVEVHASIGNLERLAYLNLKDCRNLRKLPSNIGVLKSLEILIIRGCTNLELPMELGEVESLKVLNADGMDTNRILSGRIGIKPWKAFMSYLWKHRTLSQEVLGSSLPQNLLSLSLTECNLSDDAFPAGFNTLSLLKNLNLSKNPICGLPGFIRGLIRLQTLRLNSCKKLQSIIGLPKMDKLFVGHSSSLEKITYSSDSHRPQQIEHTDCFKLFDVEGLIKLEPIARTDLEMINHLDLISLESVDNIQVNMLVSATRTKKKLNIQGLYECKVFSTFVPGREVPSLFSIRARGSRMSFTLPDSPKLKIRGLNICAVYSRSDELTGQNPQSYAEIFNKSKHLRWKYSPTCFGVPECNDNLIWFSRWEAEDKLYLESGDEVNVSVSMSSEFKLEEFGINISYKEEETKDSNDDKTQHSCGDFNNRYFLVNQGKTGVFFISNDVLRRDDIFLPTPTSDWNERISSYPLLTKDEQEDLRNSNLTKVSTATASNDQVRGQWVVVSHFLSHVRFRSNGTNS